jgi:formate hydrogenlyase subunit 3/multisubunit Na+/H+ antiporter MnhD subunit
MQPLDIVLLSRRVHMEPATLVAATLMTIGLFAKTALFPLHLWLPPAHAGAPAAASAVLSAVVVKGSFFIVVRLWFDVMPGMLGPAGAQLFGALGAAAIVFGSVVALRQQRLKLLIAYSTVAQIGYLFLMFPLALDTVSAQLQSGGALTGGMLQAISHATAKAAMFMAAGLIYVASDMIASPNSAGIARALPMTVFAFRTRWSVPDRIAAKRRLSGEMAAARGDGRDRSMVVGDRDARGRPLHKRLYVHRPVERRCAVRVRLSSSASPCRDIRKQRRWRWR